MMESLLISLCDYVISFLKGLVMTLFVDWWRNQKKQHIEITVTHENFSMKAVKSGESIPSLVLYWTIVNRSNINLVIKRIAGELYVDSWRLGVFDSDRLVERHGNYPWSPVIQVQKKEVKKKGGKSGITITLIHL